MNALGGAHSQPLADSTEVAAVQGLSMGSVVAIFVSVLLLLNFLDDPVREGVGGLQPVAMERTEVLIQESLDAIGIEVDRPCDADGQA